MRAVRLQSPSKRRLAVGFKDVGGVAGLGSDEKRAVGGFEEKWNVCLDWVLPVADFGRVFFHS